VAATGSLVLPVRILFRAISRSVERFVDAGETIETALPRVGHFAFIGSFVFRRPRRGCAPRSLLRGSLPPPVVP
jgi:hypothetical protein